MTLLEAIAALEANEADAMNAHISFAVFTARRAVFEKAYGVAMAAACRRIAAAARTL